MITVGPAPLVADLPTTRGTVYLPWVISGSEAPDAAFTRLLVADPQQQHPRLVACPLLRLAATWRAQGLASGDPWGHLDRHGMGANTYARRAGCRLPAYYAPNGNNIESLVAGTPDATVALTALLNSPSHRAHLLGEGDFFREQNRIGVARATGGPLGWYWCVLISRCEETSGE